MQPIRCSVIFPVAGLPASLNQVHVVGYLHRHTGARSCPYPSKSADVKKILGYSRHDEGIGTVDMDVVVQFDDPDFDGDSFALALAIADKRARFGESGKYRSIAATGTLRNKGIVDRVSGLAEKLHALSTLSPGGLLLLPAAQAKECPSKVASLQNDGIEVRYVSNLDELADLWQSEKASHASISQLSETRKESPPPHRHGPSLGLVALGVGMALAAGLIYLAVHQSRSVSDLNMPGATPSQSVPPPSDQGAAESVQIHAAKTEQTTASKVQKQNGTPVQRLKQPAPQPEDSDHLPTQTKTEKTHGEDLIAELTQSQPLTGHFPVQTWTFTTDFKVTWGAVLATLRDLGYSIERKDLKEGSIVTFVREKKAERRKFYIVLRQDTGHNTFVDVKLFSYGLTSWDGSTWKPIGAEKNNNKIREFFKTVQSKLSEMDGAQ